MKSALRKLWQREETGPGADEFRRASESCAATLAAAGIQVLPFRDPEFPRVMARPGSERARLLRSLEDYTAAWEDLVRNGINPRNTRLLLQRALARFGFTCDEGAFAHLDDEDVVEIYNLKNQQIFRNATFFRFADASIEELVYAEWPKVTRREMRITFTLFKLIAMTKTGTLTRTHVLKPEEVPEHPVEVLFGKGTRCLMQFRGATPVRHDGRVAGYLNWQRCRDA